MGRLQEVVEIQTGHISNGYIAAIGTAVNASIDFGGRNGQSHEVAAAGNVTAYDVVWRRTPERFNDQVVGPSPLAVAVVEQISNAGRLHVVIDAGAGSGADSIRFAQQPSAHVIAIDSSPTATDLINQRRKRYAGRLGTRSSIDIATGHIREELKVLGRNSAHIFHGGSILHIIPGEEWNAILYDLRDILPNQGSVVVSGKASGDALQARGIVVDKSDRGVSAVDPVDGIRRLFIERVEPFLTDFRAAGFDPVRVFESTRRGYDIPGQDARWQNFVLEKR